MILRQTIRFIDMVDTNMSDTSSSNAATSDATIPERGTSDTSTGSGIADGLQTGHQTELQTISGSLYVALLPTVPLDSLAAAAEDRRCALCLTTYNPDNEEPVILPCAHNYDRDCINEWLSEEKAGKTTCPTCRKFLFEHDQSLLVRRPQDDEDDANLAAFLETGETELDRFERELEERLAFVYDVFSAGCVRNDFELYDELRRDDADLPPRNIVLDGLELSVQEELALFAQLRERGELVLRMELEDRTEWLARLGDESFSLRNISGTWMHDDNALFCEEAGRNLLREAFHAGADLNRYAGLVYDLLDLGQR